MSKLDVFKLLLGQLGPTVLAASPGGAKLAPFIPAVLHGIEEAEQIKGASGPDKKKHVLSIVGGAVGAVQQATGKLLPTLEIEQTASLGIDTVISTIKLLEHAHTTVPPGALLPPASPSEG